MGVTLVIVVILGIVVVGLAWRLRRASVETVAALSDDTRSAVHESRSRDASGDVGSIVSEALEQEASQPTTRHPRPPSGDAFVTVLATYDYAELLVAKSLLEGADIPYYAKGEAVQNLIGGQLWGGHNFALGPVQLQVPADLEEEARSLLENPEPLEE